MDKRGRGQRREKAVEQSGRSLKCPIKCSIVAVCRNDAAASIVVRLNSRTQLLVKTKFNNNPFLKIFDAYFLPLVGINCLYSIVTSLSISFLQFGQSTTFHNSTLSLVSSSCGHIRVVPSRVLEALLKQTTTSSEQLSFCRPLPISQPRNLLETQNGIRRSFSIPGCYECYPAEPHSSSPLETQSQLNGA